MYKWCGKRAFFGIYFYNYYFSFRNLRLCLFFWTFTPLTYAYFGDLYNTSLPQSKKTSCLSNNSTTMQEDVLWSKTIITDPFYLYPKFCLQFFCRFSGSDFSIASKGLIFAPLQSSTMKMRHKQVVQFRLVPSKGQRKFQNLSLFAWDLRGTQADICCLPAPGPLLSFFRHLTVIKTFNQNQGHLREATKMRCTWFFVCEPTKPPVNRGGLHPRPAPR